MSHDALPKHQKLSENEDGLEEMLSIIDKKSRVWCRDHWNEIHKLLHDEPFRSLQTWFFEQPKYYNLINKLISIACFEESSSFPITWIDGKWKRLFRCIVRGGMILDAATVIQLAEMGWLELLLRLKKQYNYLDPYFEHVWFAGFNDGTEAWNLSSDRAKTWKAKQKIKQIIVDHFQKPNRNFCLVYFSIQFSCSATVLESFSRHLPKPWKILKPSV